MIWQKRRKSEIDVAEQLQGIQATLEASNTRLDQLQQMVDQLDTRMLWARCSSLKLEARSESLIRRSELTFDLLSLILSLLAKPQQEETQMKAETQDKKELEGLEELLAELDYPEQAIEQDTDARDKIEPEEQSSLTAED